MRKMTEQELARLNWEFASNNYEKRFKVCQEVVLAAIVGEEKSRQTYQQ